MCPRKLFILFAVLMFGVTLFFWQLVFAGPPLKPGNPGLPGCLAEVADKDAQIAELQAEIDELKSMALVPQTGQTASYVSGDDGELQKGECALSRGSQITKMER